MIWLFRATLLAAWLAMVFASARAIIGMGADLAGDVFFADFAHPWRGQFNTDLILHLGLVAGWIAWRENRLITAIPFAVLSLVAGGVFTFAYLLAISFTAKSEAAFLLGKLRA